jgi:hypothetical protein
MSRRQSVSIGCKISRTRTAAWWTQEYAVIRSETQEAYEVAMHSKLASDWELCDAAQAEEQRDETTQAGSVLTGCRRDCLTVEEGAWIGSLAAARHAIRSMPQIVRLMRKHQSRGWNGSNRVGGITTVFREHYKQLGSPLVCRVRRGQLDRDS